jgi:hypothetical protein
MPTLDHRLRRGAETKSESAGSQIGQRRHSRRQHGGCPGIGGHHRDADPDVLRRTENDGRQGQRIDPAWVP